MTESKRTKGKAHIGAQNDALFIVTGEAPAPNNDDPRHDADRAPIAKVLSREGSERLVACWNALEGIEDPATLRAERDALRAACEAADGELERLTDILCDEDIESANGVIGLLRAALAPREGR